MSMGYIFHNLHYPWGEVNFQLSWLSDYFLSLFRQKDTECLQNKTKQNTNANFRRNVGGAFLDLFIIRNQTSEK